MERKAERLRDDGEKRSQEGYEFRGNSFEGKPRQAV